MEAAPTAVTPPSLREQGKALFKEKIYLKTAAAYTQAIKADPENAAVYREGCALEAMERFEEALATYHEALKQDPQSADIAGKIESLTQLMLQGTIPPGTSEEVWSSVKEVIETSIKEWNDSNGKVDPGAFESPDTVNSCADFLQRYVESSAKAAVLVVSKKTIAFPQDQQFPGFEIF
ncbi:unnamed protein product [Sphagnum compactum]